MSSSETENQSQTSNFIRQIIAQDVSEGKNGGQVVTRFPPEPNGYLHIGHARSIWLNFGMAQEFGGKTNLRFDDTNPTKEDQEYVDAIKADVSWLGYEWDQDVKYTSSHFDTLYQWALHLIKNGDAYVCDLSGEEAKQYRGWATSPGKDSPYRNRSVEENLELFERMKNGEFDEGACSLRAKIDMASPNMNLRDPMLYRIIKADHHQTGGKWCIYPMYDFAHGQVDALEGITHSICTLEFKDHNPLYQWFIEKLPVPAQPKQYEFARLNLNYTVTSKRKLKQLVDENLVSGWDDPRMPTIAGLRRRGYTPAALRNFCDMVPVTSADSGSFDDVVNLEKAIRDDLNANAPRAMAVLNPLKVVITNLPADHEEMLTVAYNKDKPELGEREVPFSQVIYIDENDFKEEYSKKFNKKFCTGRRIRLRNAYVLEATDFVKEGDKVVQVNATLVTNELGKDPEDGVKPKGVVHWVSAVHGVEAELRLYDRLFATEAPDKGEGNFLDHINSGSLKIQRAMLEPALAQAEPEQSFQFEREGYYVADRLDHNSEKPVFNLTIGLRASKSLA